MTRNKNKTWGTMVTAQSITGLTIAALLSGCNSSTSTPAASTTGTTASPGSSGSTTTTTVTTGISGTISSLAAVASNSYQRHQNNRSITHGRNPSSDAAVTNLCDSGTFTAAFVGGGGTQVASGSFSGGDFTVPTVSAPTGSTLNELVLTFSCGIRCLAKTGDAGISCNPVADSVIGAFEAALNKSITDTSFAGKSIAKIGAAIVQAASNDSTATVAFNNQITTCAALTSGKAACYQAAIAASPFAGAFKMMQTVADKWTVDALFTLMADVFGADIRIDSFIYTPFGTALDNWLSTTFVADTRKFVKAMVLDQAADGSTFTFNGTTYTSNGSNFVTKIECQMGYNKFQQGGQLRFPPVMSSDTIPKPSCKNDAFLAKNGYTSSQITTIEANMDSNNGPVQLGSGNCQDWSNVNNNCVEAPSMIITSKFKEVNRNDPEGKNGGDFYNQQDVSLVNIFSEIDTAMQTAMQNDPHTGGTGSSACISMGQNGPPQVDPATSCQTYFGKIMAAQKQNFSGLLGLFLYLNNPSDYKNSTTGSSLLSLTNLHQLFTSSNSNYLNGKLAVQSMHSCGAQVSGGNYLPGILDYSNGIFTEDSSLACPIGSNNFTAIGTAAASALLANQVLPYSSDFKMFENIPSATDIKNFVFGSAYHTDWNPTGNKYFYAATVKNTGIPVFCKMTNSDTGAPKESELDSKTVITCLNSTTSPTVESLIGSTSWTDSSPIPSGYPYTLMNYGFQGDGKGSVFALSDATTGFQIMAGGKPILIHQINAGNGAGHCDGSSGGTDGTVITELLNLGWGNGSQSQAVSSYCMDMTNIQESGSLGFYYGGNLAVKNTDANGNVNTFYMPEVGALSPNSTNHALEPVCYFAATNSLTSGSGQTAGLVSSGVDTINSTTGVLTLGSGAGKGIIDLCSNTHSGTTQYYLIMGPNSQGTDRTTLAANLIASTTGAAFLQWAPWTASTTNPSQVQVSIAVPTIEAGLASTLSAAYLVAPATAQTPVFNGQVLNQKWNAKFDPYCDDLNGNGYCDCYQPGTTTLVSDPSTCTLENDAAEPTLSQSPFNMYDPNAAHTIAVINHFANASGTSLATVPTGLFTGQVQSTNNAFNGDFLMKNQIYIDTSQLFKCLYAESATSLPKSPTQLNWNNFGSMHHGGCPASANTTPVAVSNWSNVTNDFTTGGGPVRMINPVAAKNAYAITRPNTLIKMINYATKTTGQGVKIAAGTPTFALDEALALVFLRMQMPDLSDPVYVAGTTTASASAIDHGGLPYFTQVRIGNGGGSDADVISAVLRAIVKADY